MRRVISIGEMLIDFIPKEKGVSLKDVNEFIKAPGGAPANVAACVSKLGGTSRFIGQVGKDAFGDFLIDVLRDIGVDTTTILQTQKANTALAFVALKEDGNREFSFYRNPSADLLLEPKQIEESWFSNDILHFCSVSLVDFPIKQSHIKAIDIVRKNGGIISFDPNVRLSLWENPCRCQETIKEFIPLADIIKISDEELEFITQNSNEEEAIKSLFIGFVKLVIITRGSRGATLFTLNNKIDITGLKVNVVDTTGAGDAFIGGFLFKLSQTEKDLIDLTDQELFEILQFSNIVGALTTTKKGAISSLPDYSSVIELLKK